MRRFLLIFALTAGAACCLVTAGCSSPVRTMDKDTLDRRVAEHEQRVLDQRDRLAWRLLRRIERLHAAQQSAGHEGPVDVNVLLLSSGGQYGAFGVGVLSGWSESEAPDYMLPSFDIVTGVSTGAMIAPFAMTGEDYSIRRITELFGQADASFARLRGALFFLPWRTSLFDTRVLRDRIESEVDEATVEKIARAHAADQSLLIGAVDLDLGRFHVWDMGPMAVDAMATGDHTMLHNALISSASIPGAFPAVEIDGVLYADGAAALATFLGLDGDAVRQVVHAFEARNPGAPTPRLRMWMIVNGHIDAPAELADLGWTSVAVRSASVLSRYSLRTTLRQMQLGAALIGRDIGVPVDFRYISVPENVELPEPTNRLFDQAFMAELHELGARMGRDPASWRTEAIAPDIPGSSILLRDVRFDAMDDIR
ncbi:MAG: patatin-like phospholipase family protein [Phycisphaerales bacterium]|nr:MAG: patatin-like phospholipase family protein [Phycisphaerales bacterium]